MDTAPAHLRSGMASDGPPFCPVDTTLQVLGGRWKALILYNLRSGPRRFNELRRLIPNVTQRMLTQHLRELEGDGILIRHVREVVPPHVTYEISPDGISLLPVLDAMAAWGAARLAARPAPAVAA